MILRLAHVEVGVHELDRSSDFYSDVLGFEEHLRTDEAIYLRAVDEYDVWSLKLAQRSGPGLISFGLRVSSPDDLVLLRDLHDRLGIKHTTLPPAFEPGRGEGLRIRRPEGYVIDFHHEIDEVSLYGENSGVTPPMRRRGTHAGAGPVELDHVNYRLPNFKEALSYFVDELGFSISERALNPHGDLAAAWIRRTRTSHDIALLPTPGLGFHHFAYTLPDAGSLIRTADLLADAGHRSRLQFGPGRHGVSNALTMYFLDPDGNRIEFYTGDPHRDLDRPPLTWTYEEYESCGRFWWGAQPSDGFYQVTPFLEASRPSRALAGRA
jgi:catechol 2,3-dioxygenase